MRKALGADNGLLALLLGSAVCGRVCTHTIVMSTEATCTSSIGKSARRCAFEL